MGDAPAPAGGADDGDVEGCVAVTVALPGPGAPRMAVALDPSQPLGQQVEQVQAMLVPGDRPAEEMMLWSERAHEYLTAEAWIEGEAPAWLRPGTELLLIPSPASVVNELLLRLAQADREVKKRTMFELKRQLQSASFSEEFISQDGISAILALMDEHGTDGGAILAYSLAALRQTLSWQLGMDQFCDSEENVQRLFGALYCEHLKSIARALELLAVVCTVADEDAIFARILTAATRCARARDEPPFAVLIRHLRCDDLDVKLNALTLINALISTSEVGHERERLVFMLDRLQCNAVLMRSMEVRDDLFQTQLDVYAGLTHHIDLPGS